MRLKKITEGWVGTVIYAIAGVLIAYLTYTFLGFLLSTPTPIVAVVSPSMQHDNVNATHYSWLHTKLGYNRSYVDSWPVADGFSIGDMPIVVGAEKYKVGDVIVYRVGGIRYPIIHRIVATNEDESYQTKGDNNMEQLRYELNVRKEQIYGKVVFIIPKLGYFKIILNKILGI